VVGRREKEIDTEREGTGSRKFNFLLHGGARINDTRPRQIARTMDVRGIRDVQQRHEWQTSCARV
jgi:hypothetical protein